ncbi:MAG TPA: Wadjet anti-phage system protein JetD domain-containing protein [Microlunatus sp.]
MSAAWATPELVAAKVRRRWDDGSLLRAYGEGLPFERLAIALPGPTASVIGDDLSAAQRWVSRLDAGRRDDSRYSLEWSTIGGRRLGRNQVPSRAVVSSFTQAWALLGVSRDVQLFEQILALVEVHPPVRAWVLTHPHRALERRDEWSRLVAAYVWLDTHRGSGRYLREISAPGVDTKFVERQRSVLAAMLGVPSASTRFLADLGLRQKPEIVRLRADRSLGLPGPLSEIAVRADELVELGLAPRTTWVIENEITYLSVPVPPDGAVIWGKGFDVDRVGRLPWLVDVDVRYWGDLDTHGFAILDRLRAWLPQTRSVLMDRQTLLAHRDRWGTEDRPTAARLGRLSPDEQDLYGDLVVDALGDRVRLEQERIDWSWVRERIGSEVESASG